LEKGVFRVEPNISIRPSGSTKFGTRTELKNLNSFKSLADGTAYELARQAEVLDCGGQVVQETRGWHDTKRITFSQRVKEEAEDYRYFPEPDLPPLHISDAWVEQVRESLPELPDAKVARYQTDYGLSAYDARVLTEEQAVAHWFEAVPPTVPPKTIANWIINDLFRLMNEHKQAIDDIKVTPVMLGELLELVQKQTINNNTAVDVLNEMFVSGQPAGAIVEAKGLAQISNESALAALIEQVLDGHPDSIAQYLDGKDKLRGWFVGQVMKASRGKANPGVVNQLLVQALEKRR
jgi:aspartyl-tRNA(Asn)/glutamyl-tRNA(Gln) amidotransferase subunit B